MQNWLALAATTFHLQDASGYGLHLVKIGEVGAVVVEDVELRPDRPGLRTAFVYSIPAERYRGGNLSYTAEFIEFDCRSPQYRTLSFRAHGLNGDVIDSRETPSSEFEAIYPGTGFRLVSGYVCRTRDAMAPPVSGRIQEYWQEFSRLADTHSTAPASAD